MSYSQLEGNSPQENYKWSWVAILYIGTYEPFVYIGLKYGSCYEFPHRNQVMCGSVPVRYAFGNVQWLYLVQKSATWSDRVF